MKFLDTGIILCSVLKDQPHHENCAKIMRAIETGEETAMTSVLTIAELQYVLCGREKLAADTAKRVFYSLFDCAGLEITGAESQIAKKAVDMSLKYGIDFADAANIHIMEEHGITEIYSLDSDFDRFKGIKRLSSLPSASKHFK